MDKILRVNMTDLTTAVEAVPQTGPVSAAAA